MPYLDNEGLTTLWSKIKNNFAHSYSLNVSSADGARIKLMSGDGATLTDFAIPPATADETGLMTADQAGQVAKIKNLATVATTGSYSDLSGTPTSLKNPNALTIGDVTYDGSAAKKVSSLKNPNALTVGSGSTAITYDGSAAKSITAGDNVTISGGKISATDTTYSAATTSAAGLMSSTDKAKLDGIAEGAKDNIYIAQYGSDSTGANGTSFSDIATAWQDGKQVIMHYTDEVYTHLYFWLIHVHVLNEVPQSFLFTSVAPLYSDEFYFPAVNKIKVTSESRYIYGTIIVDTEELSSTLRTYAPLANPTLTGTPNAPTAAAGTNTTQIATTAFVTTAIATAATGAVNYGGTVSSADALKGKTYKKGNYYVVSMPIGTTWTGYENGDMFFAKVDKSGDGSLDDFDVVQANITAMTKDDIDDICTLS